MVITPAGTVSVLIPTFNRANYIQESVESVLAQTRPAIQVIVIDDGSEDDTPQLLARYGDRITCLRKDNGGKPAALNFALPNVTGDYVWIFDDDDVALPESIALRAAVLDCRPELGFVYSGHIWGENNADGKIAARKAYSPAPIAEEDAFLCLLKCCFFTLQGMLVRRSCYEAVGRYNEAMLRAEDYEMMVRLAHRYRFAGIAEPTFIFRRHTGLRGPKALRHGVSSRDKVHVDFDGRVGQMVRRDLKLSEYVRGPAAEGPLSPLEERIALLNRLSVMASKGLLQEMVEDLDAVCALPFSGHNRLTPAEREICEEITHHDYFWLRVSDEPAAFFARLRRCTSTALGREIMACFAKGMIAHAKSYGDPIYERGRRLGHALRFARLAFG